MKTSKFVPHKGFTSTNKGHGKATEEDPVNQFLKEVKIAKRSLESAQSSDVCSKNVIYILWNDVIVTCHDLRT